ncbi:oligosaccharide flippase family protein [Bacillales bacterium AN1005]|uniref:oligosaccharide flippase family protein n=1 Tax=Niallia taxi TaxID=2499688 RepID=UPI0021A8315C|nr:oligosaccharide flippase family protein [Niallia taxi]MCT2347470.1 oligosaccharide flippase family protein [Niallia taxi]
MSNPLFKKFMEYALGSGLVLLLGFISSPLNTRLFSPEEFGKFSMFNLWSNIIAVLILVGLDQSFVRYFHEEQEINRSKLLIQTLKIPLLALLIVSILMLLFSKVLLVSLFSTYSLSLLLLLIINNLFVLLNRYIFLVIRMQQKGKIFSYLQIAQKLLMIAFTIVFFIFLKDNFLVLISAFVFSNILVTLIGLHIEKNFWFQNNKGKKLKTTNRELVVFGYPLVFTFLITWLFQSADRIFIKHFSDYSELGLYAAAFSIVALLNSVQSAFTMFWVPVAYEKYNLDPTNKSFFEKVSKGISFIMLLISACLILSKDLLVLILGEDFREASSIVPFLIFMPLMYTVSETTVLGINFLKKSKYHIIIALLSAALNIIGNLLLVPSYGAIGAAISTGVSYILFFTLRTFISKKFYPNRYGLGKFYFCIFNLLIFAWYASFHEVDLVYIILGIETIIVICILYLNDVLPLFLKKYKGKLLRKDSQSM